MLSFFVKILKKVLRLMLESLEQDDLDQKLDSNHLDKPLTRSDVEQLTNRADAVDLRQKNLSDSDLSNFNLKGANLTGADLSRVKFVKTDLEGADLRNAICVETNFLDAILKNTLFYNADLRGARFSPYSFRTYRRGRFKTSWQIGDIELAKRTGKIADYHKAREACLSISRNLYEQGNFSDATVFRIAAMRANRATRNPLRRYQFYREVGRGNVAIFIGLWQSLFKWLGLAIPDALCVYGESVWRVVLWIILILFGLGPFLIFAAGGLSWSNAPEQTQILWQIDNLFVSSIYVYFHYLLYVFDSFTTTDFSLLEPKNDFVRFVSGMLAFVGIFFAGLLGFVAGNRIRNL